ncbi:hypothetical protein K438DRAFT_1945234 [Mycena galopus ATCC 62051]|nr:hypothetical protein K438DRAFT_1945234 [Mycena galopus ATCC 62051]
MPSLFSELRYSQMVFTTRAGSLSSEMQAAIRRDTVMRAEWARLLARGPNTLACDAILCDDTTTDALFGPKTTRRRRPRQVARLSAREGDRLRQEDSSEMYAAFEAVKQDILRPAQTVQGLWVGTRSLLETPEWSRQTGGGDLQPILEWCLRAHVALLAPWSLVKLSIVQMENLQYGVSARGHIPPNTRIYELLGRLSTDNVDGQAKSKTTSLSEMFAEDGTSRVLFGPIRFVNHSCKANSAVSGVFSYRPRKKLSDIQYEQYSPGRPDVIILVSIASIEEGEEVTVDYGDDYFEGSRCQCDRCQHDTRAVESESGRGKGTSGRLGVIADPEGKKEAKRRKNKQQKNRKKQIARKRRLQEERLDEQEQGSGFTL